MVKNSNCNAIYGVQGTFDLKIWCKDTAFFIKGSTILDFS